MEIPTIEIKNLSKSFTSAKVLDNISYSIGKGTIYGLVGENGAGKSTLIKILSGIYTDYEGEIYLNGKRTLISSPIEARELGISTIYQELSLVPKLSIIENLFLGREKIKRKLFIDKNYMFEKGKELLHSMEISINPKEIIENISLANQQVVEICKALAIDSSVLIMDEPTASLSRAEINDLFSLVRRLKEKNKTIIFVTHKIEEIFELCDYVTVLRDGKIVSNKKIEDTSPSEVIKAMIGHKIIEIEDTADLVKGKKILSIKNYSRKKEFFNINLDLFEGEIVGLAGLVGAGRTELARSIIGLTKPDQGDMEIFGKHQKFFKSPKEGLKKGLVLLPEDRKNEGLFLKLSVGDNISIMILNLISRFSFIFNSKESRIVNSLIDKIKVKTSGKTQLIENLSGGNQQKSIIARLLSTESKIYFFDEATRGVDIGSKFEIYEIIKNTAKSGNAIIYISSEIPELILVCDRIILMKDGRFIKEFKKDEKPTEEAILNILTSRREEIG